MTAVCDRDDRDARHRGGSRGGMARRRSGAAGRLRLRVFEGAARSGARPRSISISPEDGGGSVGTSSVTIGMSSIESDVRGTVGGASGIGDVGGAARDDSRGRGGGCSDRRRGRRGRDDRGGPAPGEPSAYDGRGGASGLRSRRRSEGRRSARRWSAPRRRDRRERLVRRPAIVRRTEWASEQAAERRTGAAERGAGGRWLDRATGAARS